MMSEERRVTNDKAYFFSPTLTSCLSAKVAPNWQVTRFHHFAAVHPG